MEWISVKERLPEEGVEVLLSCRSKAGVQPFLVLGFRNDITINDQTVVRFDPDTNMIGGPEWESDHVYIDPARAFYGDGIAYKWMPVIPAPPEDE